MNKSPTYEQFNRHGRAPQPAPVRPPEKHDYALHGHRVYTPDQLREAEKQAGGLTLAD